MLRMLMCVLLQLDSEKKKRRGRKGDRGYGSVEDERNQMSAAVKLQSTVFSEYIVYLSEVAFNCWS